MKPFIGYAIVYYNNEIAIDRSVCKSPGHCVCRDQLRDPGFPKCIYTIDEIRIRLATYYRLQALHIEQMTDEQLLQYFKPHKI